MSDGTPKARAWAYYRAVVARAARDTARHFTRHVIAGLVVAVLTAVFVFGAGGGDDPAQLWAPLAAGGVYLLGAFVVQAIVAPPRMYRELEARAASVDAEPVRVEYVSHDVELDRLFGSEGWAFGAHQVADGIRLTWHSKSNVGDLESLVAGGDPAPAMARCTVQSHESGRSQEIEVRSQSGELVCVYPRDFGEVAPTTGTIIANWSAQRRSTPAGLLPPLSTLRGEEPSEEELDDHRQAGERFVRTAVVRVQINVWRGGILV